MSVYLTRIRARSCRVSVLSVASSPFLSSVSLSRRRSRVRIPSGLLDPVAIGRSRHPLAVQGRLSAVQAIRCRALLWTRADLIGPSQEASSAWSQRQVIAWEHDGRCPPKETGREITEQADPC